MRYALPRIFDCVHRTQSTSGYILLLSLSDFNQILQGRSGGDFKHSLNARGAYTSHYTIPHNSICSTRVYGCDGPFS